MQISSFISSILLFLIGLPFATAQSYTYQQISTDSLKSGDLLFVGTSHVNLSGAIDRVTQTSAKTSFDHIALIERTADSVFVLHANSITGSIRESIGHFLEHEVEKDRKLVIYRLKHEYQHSIPNAITVAKTWLGKPYNISYILNDSTLYCSDFVERAFRNDQIFKLEPMTFVNPKTGQIDDFWKKHYQQLEIEVPEGLPGCNPNGMAASDKLKLVGELSKEH